MRWKAGRRSDNVVDVRGRGGGLGGGGLSIGAVVVALAVSFFTGVNPLQILGLMSGGSSGPTAEQGAAPPENDESANFVRSVLGVTEDVWSGIFQASGSKYAAPRLVLFGGAVQSGCGGASASSGPFYCPLDRQVYLDMSFFKEMEAHLGGGGEFADAYVIAHEVGHHVQTLLGISDKAENAQRRGQSTAGSSGLSVRMELQADCFAGVWAYHAQQKLQWLDSGDVDKALSTASAIGDDRLQRQTQGRVVPDAFTHGTSAQRVKWFRTGFESGEPNRCDTFSAATL
ncbi:MAG TPA: neutral zinc metallopeptidase [Candidatus Binatia bacterium]|nr:neutral zinc metallopeptidase [Candidatus Binatia bacterium]